jgi:hypothetical protein
VLSLVCASNGSAEAGNGADERSILGRAAVSRGAADFNGDGVEDLTVGAPGDEPNGIYRTGGAQVVYGAPATGDRPRNRLLALKTPGIEQLWGMWPSGLGSQLAHGDFNRDGYADLVMSVPGFDEQDPDLQRINVGGLIVVYGGPDGLDPRGDVPAEAWSQDSAGVAGISEDDDHFGSALAVGNFDGDRFPDLAIGAAGERTGPGLRHSGSVTVLYGSRSGLTGRDQVIDQDTRGILDSSERNDWAAGALAAGDFDGDGVDDLAMGVYSEAVAGRNNAGAVNVIYGMRDRGLTGRGDRFVNQRGDVVPGTPQSGDLFGAVLATGDLDGDGRDDLVIGAPEDRVADDTNRGTVTAILGGEFGLRLGSALLVTIDNTNALLDVYGARFGSSLAVGDVDADGYDEVAVGSARQDRVDVFAGSSAGLLTTPSQTIVTSEIPRPATLLEDVGTPYLVGDTFGAAVQFGEFDATRGADLVVASPRADVRVDGRTSANAGAVVLLRSVGGLLDVEAPRWFHQGAPGIAGEPGTWELFGASLSGSSDYMLR